MDIQPGQVQIPHDDSGSDQPQQLAPNTSPEPIPSQPAALAPSLLPEQNMQPYAAPVSDAHVLSEGQQNGWQYTQEANTAGFDQSEPQAVSWTASEFIEHPKGVGWYGLLGLVGVGLATADYIVTKDVVSTGVIIITAAMFGVYAAHKPRTQQYQLSPQGLRIGDKLYSFQGFKNFSVTDEGANVSVVFMPLKRFAAPLTIYVSMDLEERVLGYVGAFLPFEQYSGDVMDRLLRRIRF